MERLGSARRWFETRRRVRAFNYRLSIFNASLPRAAPRRRYDALTDLVISCTRSDPADTSPRPRRANRTVVFVREGPRMYDSGSGPLKPGSIAIHAFHIRNVRKRPLDHRAEGSCDPV